MKYIVYDFETTGRSARFDQILQAGFIVYDENFKEINRLNIRSRLNPDVVPSIYALRVNKLRMSKVLSENLSFYEMALEVRKFLSFYEKSFFIGFNSINFDEEFLRQLLWEHFFFPYLTNTNGNSRGDVFNFVTMVHAFDNKIVNVEKNDEGKLSFKLEGLARANNFDSSSSHEAIADVEVTMKLINLLKKGKKELFDVFKKNATSKNVEEDITKNNLFTLHSYIFSSHKVYLVKKLIKHPSYRNQFIGFDMKYDTNDIITMSEQELKDEFKKKSYLRKIRLNKQPSILDKSYALKFSPYSNFTKEEIEVKCKNLDDKFFLNNINNILLKESMDYLENQTQETMHEEDTIYSQNLNYNDSLVMEKFHKEPWDKKWNFAEKFKDQRLRFFAAKHIFRNYPEELPKKVFLHLHKKISERFISLDKQSFLTLPAAMEEADTLALELEEKQDNPDLLDQLTEYNIYIDFLNDYYKLQNPKPLKFDSSLSKSLFG